MEERGPAQVKRQSSCSLLEIRFNSSGLIISNMNWRDQIEYRAVAGMLFLCRHLPEEWVYAIFAALGMISYPVLGRRRKTALLNTALAFPERTRSERKRIVRRHFLNLAESMALNTLIMSGRITDERLLSMVETNDWERIAIMLEAAEKGVLVISAHIGNWELLPLYAGQRLQGRRIHVIARQSSNRLLEERIVLPMRERFGVSVFYKKNAMMKILQAARRKEPSGIMVDQKLNPPEGIRIPFFGREAGTTPAPAVLQLRLGITVLPMFMVHSGKRKYRLIVGEPAPWQDDGRPMEEQVADLTAAHQKIVEQVIREYPEQWFWVHDRWGLWKQQRKP